MFGLGVFGSAVLTLLTPLAARTSFYLFLVLRILAGIGEVYKCILQIMYVYKIPIIIKMVTEKNNLSSIKKKCNYAKFHYHGIDKLFKAVGTVIVYVPLDPSYKIGRVMLACFIS